MNGHQFYQDQIKICQWIYSVANIDIRLVDQNAKCIYQIVNNTVPELINQESRDLREINGILGASGDDCYYHYTNRFGLEFIACGIRKHGKYYGCLVAGPFISHSSIIDLTKDIIFQNKISISERKQLNQFFHSLPVFSEVEFKHLGELLLQLSRHESVSAQMIASQAAKPVLNKEQIKFTAAEKQTLIEKRYEQQNQLMNAIAKGDKKTVNRLINSTDISEFFERVPGSPIRAAKNIVITLNTMSRIGAERGGVHPVYLHSISERFAILIERTMNMPDLKKLVILMVNEYCDLVRTYSTRNYSPVVKKTVNYILFNLDQHLSLKKIAEEIFVNPSHLSRVFKKETGLSLTNFINKKRIEEAKVFLKKGNISVTDVAFMVGFNDLNYFSKVFKKYTGLIPTNYMKKNT